MVTAQQPKLKQWQNEHMREKPFVQIDFFFSFFIL